MGWQAIKSASHADYSLQDGTEGDNWGGEKGSGFQSASVNGQLTSPETAADHLLQVCKPAKTQTAWKPVLARLNLIQQLCDQFGVHAKGGGTGLPLDGVMNYIAAAFSSPNGDVRSQAVKVQKMNLQHILALLLEA